MADASGVNACPDWAHQWAQSPDTVMRHVRDVICSEWQQLRPGPPSPGQPDLATMPLEALRGLNLLEDLAADSLERMTLSAAFSDAVPLRSADDADALYTDLRLGAWGELARRSWAAQPTTLRFRTSGSTGRPKTCMHRVIDLAQEVHALAEVIGPVRRIVSAVRCHHIYGFLFTLMLPQVPGLRLRNQSGEPGASTGPVPVLDLCGRPVASVLARLQPGDLVIGFPDWWRALGRSAHELPPGVIGITSTAPCPDEVCEPLMAAGLSRLLHIYGSSETAGIGWRDWPQAHYTLLPAWQAVPDAPDRITRHSWDSQHQTCALPDEVKWLGPRTLQPVARRDGAVQVGGINVHLGAVRQQIMAQGDVADAVLRLHDFGGQPRLKLFVVPSDAGMAPDTLVAALQRFAQRHLAPPARPAHITVGPALPVNAAGKACDWPVPNGLA
jgi:long-chain acyl-CoA synthetase